VPTTKKTPKAKAQLKGFAERIGILVKQKSLRGLAREAGVNTATLSSWENGVSARMDKIYEFCDTTGVSFEWLTLGKGPMYFMEAGTPDKRLAPANLEKTVTDLNTVHKLIVNFERNLRKKGKSYTPEQVANAIILLCIIAYGDVSKQDGSEIVGLLEGL